MAREILYVVFLPNITTLNHAILPILTLKYWAIHSYSCTALENSRTGKQNCLKAFIFYHMLTFFICYIKVHFTFALVDCVC